MVMEWKDLEGKIFEIDYSDLTDEKINRITELDIVESIEKKTNAQPTGVSYYYRLVLKEKIPLGLGDELPQELTEIVPYKKISSVGHPAGLLDYDGTLTIREVDVENSEKLKKMKGIAVISQLDEIEGIIKKHLTKLETL